MARARSLDSSPRSHYDINSRKPQTQKSLFRKEKRSEFYPQALFPFIYLILDTHDYILIFCDVFTLGTLGFYSKKSFNVTREDSIQEERPKQIFERRYDTQFLQINVSGPTKMYKDNKILKLSLWLLKSTTLVAWFRSWVLGFQNLVANMHRPDGESNVGKSMMFQCLCEEGFADNDPLTHRS